MTGLLHVAQQEQCIDLSRVAVHGWSYGKHTRTVSVDTVVATTPYCYYCHPKGGYMSIMCLAQRPDIFKVRWPR